MNRIRAGLAIPLIMVLMFVAVGTALAKGPPSKIVITGPGIDDELEISDPETLLAFSFYMFNDLNKQLDAEPEGLGEGYRIARYIFDNDGKEQLIWDHVTWYPDPSGEGPGYVYFDGLAQPGMTTEGQGFWYDASEKGGSAMERIVAAQIYKNAPPAPEEPAPAPVSRGSNLTPVFLGVFVTMFIGMAVTMYLARRKAQLASQPKTATD